MVILGRRRDKYKIIGQKAVGRGNDFVGGFVVESAKNELFLNYLVQGIRQLLADSLRLLREVKI